MQQLPGFPSASPVMGTGGQEKTEENMKIHTVFHVVAFEPRVTSILLTSVTLWQDKL